MAQWRSRPRASWRRRATGIVLFSGLVLAAGCRAVLGIDEDRPLRTLPTDAETVDEEVVEPPPDAAPDVRPKTYCDGVEPRPVFCADFDYGDVLFGWSNANRTPDIGQSGGGKIEADTAVFTSGPRSASLRIPGIVSSVQSASAILVVTVRGIPAEGATITFDLQIDTELFPEGQGIVPVIVAQLKSPGEEEVTFLRRASGMYLATSTDIKKVEAPFALGKMKSVELAIDRRVTTTDAGDEIGGYAQLRFDVLNVARVALPVVSKTASEITISVGPITQGPIGEFEMHIDNFRVYRRADL